MVAEDELARVVPQRDTALTIGVFDGVHLGHQRLIGRLLAKAASEGLQSGVITFNRHPRLVLSPQAGLTYLTDIEERVRLIRGLGVELVVALTFTPELSRLSAREFVMLLKKHLRVRALVIGPDFALGRGREGDGTALKALGEELGFSVEVVSPHLSQGAVVSSTAVRAALARGDVREVGALLGRPFVLSGPVSRGEERGRGLGFPTANLVPGPEQALPADGVYATRALLGDEAYQSVTNIGIRPTFGGGQRLIETHLLDFEGELYGRALTVELVERLRGEMKFQGPDELKAQIARDIARAREILRA